MLLQLHNALMHLAYFHLVNVDHQFEVIRFFASFSPTDHQNPLIFDLRRFSVVCSELHQNVGKCALFGKLAANAPELVGFVIVTPVAWRFHQWWFINKDGFGINALLDLWSLSLSPKIVLERLFKPFDVGCSVFLAD